MRFTLTSIALAVAASMAVAPRRAAAQPAPVPVTKDGGQADGGQRLRSDPNYATSAEKKYRERVKKQTAARQEAEAAQEAYKRFAAVMRAHSAASPAFPRIPFLSTLLFSGAGAIIGHQSHHAWQGAGIGAAVGALVDAHSYQARRRTPY